MEEAITTSWNLRPAILISLALPGFLFLRGWLRLRRKGRRNFANGWRLTAYFAGLGVLAVALLSPIDSLGDFLFFMHMIEHLLLIMWAAPLLVLANPLAFLLWGLPGGRRVGAALFSRRSLIRDVLQALTRRGVILLLFVVVLWGWHDPIAYNAALRVDWLHDLEHFSFFAAGLLFWWIVIGAAPRLQYSAAPLFRVGYVLVAAAGNMIPGVVISLASAPLYAHYLSMPRVVGISALQDQIIGGMLMWVPGTMIFVLTALLIVLRNLEHLDARPGGLRHPIRAQTGPIG